MQSHFNFNLTYRFARSLQKSSSIIQPVTINRNDKKLYDKIVDNVVNNDKEKCN